MGEKGRHCARHRTFAPWRACWGGSERAVLLFEGPSKQEIDRFTAALNDTFHKGRPGRRVCQSPGRNAEIPQLRAAASHRGHMTLDALLMLRASFPKKQEYSDQVTALYEQAVRCGSGTLRDRSRFLLATNILTAASSAKPRNFWPPCPSTISPISASLTQLLQQQGNTAGAASIYERKLLALTGELQGVLLNLLGIALDEGRAGDATSGGALRPAGRAAGRAGISALLPVRARGQAEDLPASLDLLKSCSPPSLAFQPPAGPFVSPPLARIPGVSKLTPGESRRLASARPFGRTGNQPRYDFCGRTPNSAPCSCGIARSSQNHSSALSALCAVGRRNSPGALFFIRHACIRLSSRLWLSRFCS